MTDLPSIVADAVHRAIEDLRRRPLPLSTYRLQFHKGFNFRDATAIVPYLAALGISHCYASPYLKARPGSTHGYDVIDHNALNPELGSQEDFDAFLAALRRHGMGHILDTVPNHAGVGTNDNRWWNDVLENGRLSPFAECFDITWDGAPRPVHHGKVLIPTLGEPYGTALDKGDLKLVFDDAGFAVVYFDRRFPLNLEAYRTLLKGVSESEHAVEDRLRPLLDSVSMLANDARFEEGARPAGAVLHQRHAEMTRIKQSLAQLASSDAGLRKAIEQTIAGFNGRPGENGRFDRLDALLCGQHFRLAHWRVAPDEINYRRFFDINDLAALAMERQSVFEVAHQLTFDLLASGKLDGLRIDHPDGLYEPRQYLRRLQAGAVRAVAKRFLAQSDGPTAAERGHEIDAELDRQIERAITREGSAPPLYVTVEKILAMDEPMPRDWPCHGTSGYDFLVLLNGLFVDAAGESELSRLYAELCPETLPLDELIYRKKKLILQIAMASELRMLTHRLDAIAEEDRHARDFTESGLRQALMEVIACFGVYRTYVTDEGIGPADVQRIDHAVNEAVRRNPRVEPAVFHFIRDVLRQHSDESLSRDARHARRTFAGKFQQLTAPATAKGIEDTAFYLYNRLISLNEVGGEPSQFGTPPDALHGYLKERQEHWPFALSPLSTHDTKRSEDVRARISVLSEIPGEWAARVQHWMQLARTKRAPASSQAPGPNEQYLFFQTLLGMWPLGGDPSAVADVLPRVQAYMQKALREGKQFTSWTDPDSDYESAVEQYIAATLDPDQNAAFFEDFLAFQRRVAPLGLINSLSQTLIRLTAPGVPDTYQGTELWDFSLVDPDNRRPVDYPHRETLLSQLDRAEPSRQRLQDWLAAGDPLAKLFVTRQALAARRSFPELFGRGGNYTPLSAKGSKAKHCFAYLRDDGEAVALVATVRLPVGLLGKTPVNAVPETVWGDTTLELPAGAEGKVVTDNFSGNTVRMGRTMPLGALFGNATVGLWTPQSPASQ